MASIRNSIQINKRIMILVAVLLAMILVLLTKFYFSQKKENRALRLKILSTSDFCSKRSCGCADSDNDDHCGTYNSCRKYKC
jgi:sensor histidine kinase regulating citrate/malate metabolism